jgi:SAM-dependent methyltransferase
MMDPLSEISMNARTFSYDSIAAEYATKVDSAPYNALYERPAMMKALPDIAGQRIFDAGCGSGWYAEQLLERGAILTAVDASSAMVEYARARLEKIEAGRDRLDLRVADLANRLPFDDAAFDGIVSPLVLHYMRDWRPPLKEFHRLLVPGGWLLFSTHHPAADAANTGTQNYFATEHIVEQWDWVGTVEFYRRPLTEIVDSLTESGFVIENLVEPAPSEELKRQDLKAWNKIMHQPQFLIVKARA